MEALFSTLHCRFIGHIDDDYWTIMGSLLDHFGLD